MTRSGGTIDHGVEKNGCRGFVDNWRASDADRINVPAVEQGQGHRFSQRPAPYLFSGPRIKCVDYVVFSCDQQHARVRTRFAPVQWLSVDMPRHLRVKGNIQSKSTRPFPGQRRDNEIAAAIGMSMISEDRIFVRCTL